MKNSQKKASIFVIIMNFLLFFLTICIIFDVWLKDNILLIYPNNDIVVLVANISNFSLLFFPNQSIILMDHFIQNMKFSAILLVFVTIIFIYISHKLHSRIDLYKYLIFYFILSVGASAFVIIF